MLSAYKRSWVGSHLAGYKEVDFPSVVLIISHAFVNLGFPELRETIRLQAVDRFAILKQAYDVVDADAGTFNDGVATPHAG